MATRIRAEVNYLLFFAIERRTSAVDQARLLRLVEVDPFGRRSEFDSFKRPARRPSLSRLKEHTEHLRKVDAIGDTAEWLADVPPAKIAHFAGEARVLDAADLDKFSAAKKLALLACFVHMTRVRARDELAGMLCRRMAALHKRGREHLEAIRERQRAETERLWGVFGQVLAGAREAVGVAETDETAADAAVVDAAARERAGALMLAPLDAAGGVAKVSAEHAEISAHHGNNYMPLLARHFRSHRSALFDLLDVLALESTSADDSVLAAVRFVRTRRHRTRDFISDHDDGEPPLDMSFCSQN